jgi:hypothetical protein
MIKIQRLQPAAFDELRIPKLIRELLIPLSFSLVLGCAVASMEGVLSQQRRVCVSMSNIIWQRTQRFLFAVAFSHVGLSNANFIQRHEGLDVVQAC